MFKNNRIFLGAILLILVTILLAPTAVSQTIDYTQYGRTAPFAIYPQPPGLCFFGDFYLNRTTNTLQQCTGVNNLWTAIGGGLTVAQFASPPASPTIDQSFLFTDATSSGTCGGGGTAFAVCAWNGSTFVATGGTSTGLGDPGSNSIVYRSGAGTSIPATATQMSSPNYCLDVGATNTFSCNLSPNIASYTIGTLYWFKAASSNTGASTVNFSSRGAVPIKKVIGGVATTLAANDIASGQLVAVLYDGMNMQVASQIGTGVDLGSAQSLTNKTVDGVSPTTMGFVDPTSSIQTQLNGKASSSAATTVNSQSCGLSGACTVTVPISTGVTGLGTGVGAWLATPGGGNFFGALVPASGTCSATTFFRGDGACAAINLGTMVTGTLGLGNGGIGATSLLLAGIAGLGANNSWSGSNDFNSGSLNIVGSGAGYHSILSGLTGSTPYNITIPATTANDILCLETLANCGSGSGTANPANSGSVVSSALTCPGPNTATAGTNTTIVLGALSTNQNYTSVSGCTPYQTIDITLNATANITITWPTGFGSAPTTFLSGDSYIISGNWTGSTYLVKTATNLTSSPTGLLYGNGGADTSAATAAQVVGVINTTPVANATSAANAIAIDGVTITGTPTAGQVPTATGGSAAAWQTPSGGTIPLTITTGSTYTVTGSGQFINENATTGAAVTYTLPVAAANTLACVGNGYNGAANTGALTLQTSGSGQYIIFTDGTLTPSGGYVKSTGAAMDQACLLGLDATHWIMQYQGVHGSWSKSVSGPVLVGHIAAQGSTNTTTSGLATGSATLLVAVLSFYTGGGATGAVSSSPSNTWACGTPQIQGNYTNEICYVYSPTVSGSQTFECVGTLNYCSIEVLAFSGTVGTTVDQQNGTTEATVGTGTSAQVGSVTPTATPEVLITGAIWNTAYSGLMVDSMFTISDQQNVTVAAFGGAAAYLIQSSITPINPNWTWTTGNTWCASIATFK